MTERIHRPVVVAISGGSATGKSTLARRLARGLEDLGPIVVGQDRYFRDFAELTPEERERQRTANHPNSLLWPAFHAALDALCSGGSIDEPTPGTRAYQRGDPVQRIGPARVVIFEGLFTLWDERCRQAADLRVYTDLDDDERVLRRIERDIAERGGKLDGIISWYRRDVKPNFPTYTHSTRRYADLIVPTAGPIDVAVGALVSAVRDLAAKRSEDSS